MATSFSMLRATSGFSSSTCAVAGSGLHPLACLRTSLPNQNGPLLNAIARAHANPLRRIGDAEPVNIAIEDPTLRAELTATRAQLDDGVPRLVPHPKSPAVRPRCGMPIAASGQSPTQPPPPVLPFRCSHRPGARHLSDRARSGHDRQQRTVDLAEHSAEHRQQPAHGDARIHRPSAQHEPDCPGRPQLDADPDGTHSPPAAPYPTTHAPSHPARSSRSTARHVEYGTSRSAS